MSLVKSHHIDLNEKNTVESSVSLETIKAITKHILEHYAPLIVDIESGKVHKIVLEKEIVAYLDGAHQFQLEREEAIRNVMDYMFGYGPLQAYIEDEDITDIDVCQYNFILIKKHGKKEMAPLIFSNQESFLSFCKLIVVRNGGVINEKDCHARVSDEKHRLRINVTIPPRNTSGPSMTIRKHRQTPYNLKDLQTLKMMDEPCRIFLEKIMILSPRILIVGKGASGKTTLLRALLNEIPYTERFLICESDRELYTEQSNFIVQKVQSQHKSSSLNDLIKDGLTMSLDGYCIGELVGPEVFEFLKAGYTDHRVMGTLHAQSVEDTLLRVKSMLKQEHVFVDDFYIGGAIDLIIFVKKFKIIEICELSREKDEIVFNTMIKFHIQKENDHRLLGFWKVVSELKYNLKNEWIRRL